MHKRRVATPQAQTHLTHGFEERQRFNITDRATNLDNRDIGLTIVGCRRTALDEGLNFVGDVWDNLNGFSKIFATTLFFEHRFVNLPCREIIGFAHFRADESLVMS